MKTAAHRWRHWARLLTQPAYRAERNTARHRQREIERLSALPRFTLGSTDLLGSRVEFVDAASFLWTHYEIYENRIYEFRPRATSVHIVDGGANIGLSILFFKSLLPGAHITAFEPDRIVRQVLERNVQAAQLTDVRLEPYALWSSETLLPFAADGADGGRIAAGTERATDRVQTVRLRDYLVGSIDLLKLDIEGAESEVLQDCEDLLHVVERVYVEYHSFVDRPQTLHLLLGVLQRAGFRVHIAPVSVSRQPFLRRPHNNGFDLQLHVFGYRDL